MLLDCVAVHMAVDFGSNPSNFPTISYLPLNVYSHVARKARSAILNGFSNSSSVSSSSLLRANKRVASLPAKI